MIEAFLFPVQAIWATDQRQMFTLLQTHFQGVSWAGFQRDLQAKNWVILLKAGPELKGFTTLAFYSVDWQEQTLSIVYSGDTITDPSIWSSPALAKAWVKTIQTLHQNQSANKNENKKLYWLLISSGYRTYRFLSIFAKEFYPHYTGLFTTYLKPLAQHLAQQKFQENYNLHTNIVRFRQPQILVPSLQQIPPEKLNDRHVDFFVRANPGHSNGDELVCLAEVSENNLTKAGQRIWQGGYPLHIPCGLG